MATDALATSQPLPLGEIDERADQVMVRMRDGVRLATDVYLGTMSRRAPTVLVRLPYDKTGSFSFLPLVAPHFTEAGYNFVTQDVRGKCRSEGDSIPFVSEAVDGYDTIDWIVRQKWANGVVCMFGDSYYGFTQWCAAASGHPALKAISPHMTWTSTSPYDLNVFCLYGRLEWVAHTWLDRALYDFPIDWSYRPLSDLVPSIVGRRLSFLDQWIASGPEDPCWTEIAYGNRHPHKVVKMPVLHSGGWWDVGQRGQIADYMAMRARPSVRDHQFLIMDATDHFDDPIMPDGLASVDYLSDPLAMQRFLPRYVAPALQFFDLCLRSSAERFRLPRARWHMAHAGWRSSDDWPPPSHTTRLYLGRPERAVGSPGGGVLTLSAESRSAVGRWVHDPSDLVPTAAADSWRPLLAQADEGVLETRPDVLSFRTEDLSEAIEVAGVVTACLTVSSSAPSIELVVKLVDIWPSGAARLVLRSAKLINQARDVHQVSIQLGHVAYRLQAGHRIGLQISCSDYPYYIWHPGDEVDPWIATEGHATTQTIACGRQTASYLDLPRLLSDGQESSDRVI